MQTAVIYCRESGVSTLPTDVKFENQEEDCRAYAAKQGYDVAKVYRESHSGADLLRRPMIWDAIDDVKNGTAQVILVRNWDRLARKSEHAAVIRWEVREKAKGRIESALDSNEGGTLADKIMDLIAEGERQNTVTRMVRGSRKRAERGELLASAIPLYGYTYLDDEPGKRTMYAIDPETGPTVQRMFHLVISGNSLRAVARLFNAQGIPTPSMWAAMHGRGGRRRVSNNWNLERVRNIISDHSYTGEKDAYRWVYKEGESGKKFQVRTSDSSIGVKTKIPALVDQQTWETAQRAVGLGEHAGRPPHDREATWLRKYVYCGVCGSPMIVRHSITKGTYVYICNREKNRVFDGKPCPGGSFIITNTMLDKPVYEALASALVRRKELGDLMMKRLGTGKLERLVSMSESFQQQIQEKQEDMRIARRRATQTRDDELAQGFIEDAERLLGEIRTLEREYADTREMLDSDISENRWVQATLESIYSHALKPIPTPEDVKAFPYEERRLLLAATAMHVNVYPKGWPDHERVECVMRWELKRLRYGLFHLTISIHDLSRYDTC